MAITITQQPALHSPVYNPLIYVALSDNVSQPNFNYIFDVYVDGALQSRHRLPARPVDGYAIFDAGSKIEDQITHNIDLGITDGFNLNTNSFLSYVVKIGEEYDVAGVRTLNANLATSAAVEAYNGIFDDADFISAAPANYILAGINSKYLTNAPTSQKIKMGESAWLYFITQNLAGFQFVFKFYSSTGGFIKSFAVYAPTPRTVNFLSLNVGTLFIESVAGAGYLDGVASYTVSSFDSTSLLIPRSETRRYVIDSACTKYEITRLHFLNKPGGFDSFSFTKVSKDNSDIVRTGYKVNGGTFSAGTLSYSASDRRDVTSSTKISETTTLNSNWLTEAESTWLKELVTSPVVFKEVSGVLVAVKIKTATYAPQKKVNNKLFNLSIQLEGTDTYRQRY